MLRATFFVALYGLFAPAFAQFSSQTGDQAVAKTVVTSERVRAELMAWAPDGVGPGKTVWVGLQLAHQPEWHTYWKNSGDSGLPTVLDWKLPAGVTAGEIAWPVPQKIRIGDLANYGYEGTVLLPVPLTIGSDFKPGILGDDLAVQLKAAWLVCRKECIPEEGAFALRIPLKSSTALNAAAFDAALKAQPAAVAAGVSKVEIAGKLLKLSVGGLPASAQGRQLTLFAETPEVIETAATPKQTWQGAVWTAELPISGQRSNSPAVMPLVLVSESDATRTAWRVEAAVQGNWPAVEVGGAVSPELAAALGRSASQNANMQANAPAQDHSWAGLALALLSALLGGMILNLMPCVFPVLAIKLLGFAQHADDRRGHRVDGLAYSAGVVLSFVALGALMLALRAGGEALGWGFQLQSPAVVAGLALLFTLLGLNLAGVFEFGQFVPSRLAALEARHPAVDALLSGVLAVAIASPCTAPFMGASLGLAVGLPAAQALLVFGAVGVGMALPYLAASMLPAVARLLPRPGIWMNTLRRFMAFPMFATVAWLVWVLGQQSGIDGAGAMLALLVAASSVVWAFSLAGRTRAVLATVLIAVSALLMLTIGPNITKMLEPANTQAAAGARWQAWEPGRVEQVLAQGQPVFVDFTAAWCVTCQYNKKTTLANPGLLAAMDAKKLAFLRADWTRRDPAITAALGQLGRNGVPVYVLYAPGKAPVVLSEVLTVDEVQAALQRL